MTAPATITIAGVTYKAPRRFRWYDVGGHRHAIPRELADGRTGRSLCDELDVTPVAGVSMMERKTCWSTCANCDDKWRAAEDLPSRAEIKAALEKRAALRGRA